MKKFVKIGLGVIGSGLLLAVGGIAGTCFGVCLLPAACMKTGSTMTITKPDGTQETLFGPEEVNIEKEETSE